MGATHETTVLRLSFVVTKTVQSSSRVKNKLKGKTFQAPTTYVHKDKHMHVAKRI